MKPLAVADPRAQRLARVKFVAFEAGPRAQRLAQVKFVALDLDAPAAVAPHRPKPCSFLATLRETLLRVIGCPVAARP